MNSSQLTRYRASHNISAFYETISRTGQQSSYEIREGARPLILRNNILVPAIIPTESIINDLKSYPILDSILSAFTIFLQWIVSNGLGPTVTSRVLYIWNMALSTAWTWIQERSYPLPLQGIHDNWNWDKHATNILSEKYCYVWMNHAMAEMMEDAFPGISMNLILSTERSVCGWTEITQTAENLAARSLGNWSEFIQLWKSWLTIRNDDGALNAIQTQPTSDKVPNIGQEIETDSSIIPSLADPNGWTPLKIPGKIRQKYLTYSWDSVQSTGISPSAEEVIDTVADALYIPPGSARNEEIDAVISITASLTDSQKVIAEFWAGGPQTVTPPGMMAWIWKEYVRSQAKLLPLTKVIFSGLDLAIHLFEGSRLTWRNKARKVQSRPIQEIRIRYASDSLSSWNGETVLGALWMPYQETDFVTPPFPDFPSGHSHFSQAFANTMKAWFGDEIPAKKILKTDLVLLSPAFAETPNQTGSVGEYTFPTGKSQIQSGSVPSTDITLSWTTWQDMADSAGISRLYGGIHCLSAHTSSQAIANALHTELESVWGFRR
jgi:hypothetical protein